MPPMPLELRIVTVALIVLLAGLIAVYHVWLDRRRGVGKTAPPSRPASAGPVPGTVTPSRAAGVAASAPATEASPRRTRVQRAP